MNIKEYLKNVHGKIKRGYTKEAREMLDNLRISLEGNERLEGYKPTGLRLERDIDMVDKKEVYVLRLRQGTPEYAVGKKVLDIIPKMYKLLEKGKAKKPAEQSLKSAELTSLESRVQRDARIKKNAQDIRARSRIFKESIKDLKQDGYIEEPVQTKRVGYKAMEPTKTVSEVTEPEKPKVYTEAPMPEILRSYLLDAYNKIEDGKLKEAREKLGKKGQVTMRRYPQTTQLLYKKLVKAENEKRERSSTFWNKCKRAVAYGLVGGMLLFFSGASVKHELEQRAMNDLPEQLEPIPPHPDKEEIDRLIRGRGFKIDKTGWDYKEITC